MFKKIRQFLCWHEYPHKDTRGWYGEPKPGAVCIKCDKVNN